MKFYIIECLLGTQYSGKQYRYKSLYNGATGSWEYDKKYAIEQGEDHAKLIQHLFNKNSDCLLK